MPRKKKITLAIFFTGIGAVVGFLIGFVFQSQNNAGASQTPPIRLPRVGNYSLISPLLVDSEVTNNSDQTSIVLEEKIHDATYDLLDDPSINLLSIYFRDLSSAKSVGIKQDQLFDSGSLLKTSLLIAALKENEDNPGFLSETVVYPGRPPGYVKDQFEGLTAGQSYSVQTLLDDMIVHSYNDAKDLLFITIDQKYINDLYESLNLPIPNPTSTYQISPHTYSYFFRILYNATYLTPNDSNLALQLLSESDYPDGLVSGVPDGITVAHKYGQAIVPNPNSAGGSLWELHDCGIIYYPNRPYFLCVMTRGNNLDQLQKIIATTSQVVYQEVANNFE